MSIRSSALKRPKSNVSEAIWFFYIARRTGYSKPKVHIDMSKTPKRPRVSDGCSISLVSVTPLRIMVELLEGILTHIEFKADGRDNCIRVESIDAAGVCVATGKLVCTVECTGAGEQVAFTVNSGILKTCLKTLNAYQSIDMVYDRDVVAAKLLLNAYEISSSITSKFQLPVLDIATKPLGAFDMKYDFTFELELNTLRNITKNALLLKGDEIQFTVRTNSGFVELTIFTDGGAEQEHVFCAKSTDHSTPVRIDEGAEVDEENFHGMRERYKHRFSVSYMNKFLVADSQLISLRLSPNKPLILNYPLGIEDSFVSFVLSPRVTACT